jgi:hypothetical protein
LLEVVSMPWSAIHHMSSSRTFERSMLIWLSTFGRGAQDRNKTVCRHPDGEFRSLPAIHRKRDQPSEREGSAGATLRQVSGRLTSTVRVYVI